MSKTDQTIAPQNFVKDILNHLIYLENISDRMIGEVTRIGAFQKQVAGKSIWVIEYTVEDELADRLHELNRLGFCFVGEPAGWPPAAVFEELRNKGTLAGTFTELRWHGPGDWYMIKR